MKYTVLLGDIVCILLITRQFSAITLSSFNSQPFDWLVAPLKTMLNFDFVKRGVFNQHAIDDVLRKRDMETKLYPKDGYEDN